jgi:hypothetical protein
MPDLIRNPEVLGLLDSGFRRNDDKIEFLTFYEAVNLKWGVTRNAISYYVIIE